LVEYKIYAAKEFALDEIYSCCIIRETSTESMFLNEVEGCKVLVTRSRRSANCGNLNCIFVDEVWRNFRRGRPGGGKGIGGLYEDLCCHRSQRLIRTYTAKGQEFIKVTPPSCKKCRTGFNNLTCGRGHQLMDGAGKIL
jgi:hypothetical protein